MNRFLLVFIIIFSITPFVSCGQKKQIGIIDVIEFDAPERTENPPPYKNYGSVRYGSWEEAYADGWEPSTFGTLNEERYSQAWFGKPNGFVIVKLSDGNKIRCKNPYPEIGMGKKVYIKETSTGDWVVAGVITEKAKE